MPESHMEVGCPGTQGLELRTPNPGSKNIPKACSTCNPATRPACPAEGLRADPAEITSGYNVDKHH